VDKRYLNAFLIPPQYSVGGIALDIFCPRHFITLQAVNSPFVSENPKGISYKDLFIALRICSTPSWREAVKKPNIKDRIKYIIIESFAQKQAEAFQTFGRYMSESMSAPKVWIKDDDKKSKITKENIPKTLSIVVCLVTKFGFSENEAWNMPFSRALWYTTAYASQEGADVEIITTEDEENEKLESSLLAKYEEEVKNKIRSENRKANVN